MNVAISRRMMRTVRQLPTGIVTFLFTDIEGSTRLIDELGEERYSEALAEHRRVLRKAFSRRGGVEVDTQGDAFLYAFPDAAEALAAAADGQDALASGPVKLRIGVHTGEPRLTAEGYVGKELHRAARIAACGHGRQVVVSAATRALVDAELTELGEHRLKDFPEPVALFQLGSERFPPLRTISNTNLPRPASSFVGRERELGELMSLLSNGTRLVTLSGPGGSGKTRLAVEVASQLVTGFKAGVFWVGLSALRDPALVPESVAQTLGAKDGLAEHIAERDMLLLLDNLEQVVEAGPELSQLVEACPNLRLLVTSRELLRVRGEVEYPVPPLAEPDAVELFCARARLEPDETVAELCRRLDELPLAIELAAARTSIFSPPQILERLSQRLDLLRGGRDADPRQQTLRATIEWSYELLDEEEQRLFAGLAVFRGGCTLEAAEEVADANLDTLQSLVDKSLVRHTGERFWMLETIREYALERLEEAGKEVELSRRHATYYLELAEEMDRVFAPSDLAQWLARLRSEHDNFVQTLEWARDQGEEELVLRLVGAVADSWRLRGLNRERRTWLGVALDCGSVPNAARLAVLDYACDLALERKELERADTLTAELRSAAEEAGDSERLMNAKSHAARLALYRGDLKSAREGFRAAKELAAKLGDRGREAGMAVNLGVLDLGAGEFRTGLEYSIEGLAGFRETGDESGVSAALSNCGWSALCLADAAGAAAWFREALLVADRLGSPMRLVNATEGLAIALVVTSSAELGAQLLGAASSLREELEVGLNDDLEEEHHERAVADAKQTLGEDRFAAAWERGCAMTPGEIVELASAAQKHPR